MTWKPQPLTVAAPPSDAAVRIRVRAVIGAVLFVPALIVMLIMVLATETGSRCVMKGGCAPFPGALFLTLCGAAVVAMVLALGAAPMRMRKGALTWQLLLEAVAVCLVLVPSLSVQGG
ncbi:hypothetical protein [Streptomyces sp. NBC_00091]|uniref:hypothetical protein n=1 Tax=Streptomyces sp. NBC_00091 TaxID=2975648 RepID=UPI0022583343|nr:hypothetical protein [Streptomyces sp. NBC_00091]MCX5377618.1 hypothetical protein [Streptomyces sp. NBC_00091]